MDETALVARLVAAGWKGSRDVLLGPGDDAAVMRGGLAASTDLSVEGVHFRFEWVAAREVGFRAAAAALSDMAAMGARPVALLVSLAVPPDPDLAEELQRGARRAADRVSVPIAGGDVSRSPGPVMIDMVALGRAPRGLVRRSGAEPGHDLWVSGEIGAAAAAAAAWSAGREPRAAARSRFAAPPDRVPLGRALAAHDIARSMIDVSDGLLADARRLAEASSVALVVRDDRVPVDPCIHAELGPTGSSASTGSLVSAGCVASSCSPVSSGPAISPHATRPLNFALEGGEDYELMFTAESGARGRLKTLGKELSVSLTRIGTVERGQGVIREGPEGRRRVEGLGGHDHFARP